MGLNECWGWDLERSRYWDGVMCLVLPCNWLKVGQTIDIMTEGLGISPVELHHGVFFLRPANPCHHRHLRLLLLYPCVRAFRCHLAGFISEGIVVDSRITKYGY